MIGIAPWFIAALAAIPLLAACAGPTPTVSQSLRWPEPPETVRIEFAQVIAGPADIRGQPSTLRKLGEILGVTVPMRGRPIAHPADIVVSDDARTLYVSDFAQGIVHVFDLETGTTRYLGEADPFARPFGLALDAAGNLYVAEQAARQIRVVSPSGATLRVIKSDRLIRPVDIALDEKRGRLYVADGSHQNSPEHFIRVLSLDGEYLGEVGSGRGSEPGELLFPTYLAVDDEGNLYVTDTMNSRVAVFDADGALVRIVGDRGDGFGTFDKPKGVALDSFGNLYVVDSSWSNVQMFGPMGDVLLFFAGRGGLPGHLRNPTGIAISRDHNRIFVADYLNHRICIYQLVNTERGDGLPPKEGTS